MKVTVTIPEELAEKARARGLTVEAFIEEVLARHVQQTSEKADARTLAEAVARITRFRNAHPLGDMNIKDLISEGRK